ncbi:DNA primase [Streptomyces sp. NBC_01235]|uniref:DNA primase n=1 Tax=Streptomyces sp. NBC_01235 TaxID=2903788 RepID=UPI002E0E48A5|nr:DNA primase [Streptomyces sp. NBC_01235]
MNRMGLGLAVGAGYVLGRTKKLKMAFAIGSLVAGKKLNLTPRALGDLLSQQLRDNPQFKEIGDQLRQDLRGVGKAASGAMVERQMDALADRLHGRTSQVRDQLEGVVPGTDEDGEQEADEEYEEPQDAQDEEEGEVEDEEPQDTSEEDEEQDEDEEEEPPRKTAAKKAPAKKTAKKAAAKKAPAKKAPARRTAEKRTASAGKTATRTASRTASGSGSRARRPKGGGDR